jgi:hypothetical protein
MSLGNAMGADAAVRSAKLIVPQLTLTGPRPGVLPQNVELLVLASRGDTSSTQMTHWPRSHPA